MFDEQEEEIEVVEKTKRVEFVKSPFSGNIYFTGVKDCSSMVLPFGEHFEFGKPYEHFKISLSSKRIFNRSILDIADDNNRILNHSFNEKLTDVRTDITTEYRYNENFAITNEFLLKYLSLKMNIDDGGELIKVEYEVFISELMNIITDNLLKIIINYIDMVYIGCMDDAISVKKTRKEITIGDAEIKRICIVKYSGNLLVPLCTHYCNSVRGIDSKEFFLDLYKALFERCDSIDIMDKIHKLVTSTVSKAVKENTRIYDRMSITGTTRDSEIEEVFSKIMTTIITKISPIDTAPALMVETAKRSSSKYKPQKNDGYEVLRGFSDDCISSGSDDSVVTEAERVDSRIARPDELLKIVKRYSCDDTINKISIRCGVSVGSNEEYFHTINTMDLHSYQTKTLFQMFYRPFGSFDNIYENNRHNYARLLIVGDKYLRSIGLDIIADYISAKCIGHAVNQRWSGKVSDKKFFEHPKYVELLNTKYKFTKAQFVNKNFIRDDVLLLTNSRFIYNGFNDPRFEQPIKHTDDEIIEAVLDYYLKAVV